MSQENVDALREALEAYNRHDLGAFLALMHDDVEARPPMAGGTPVEQESWHVAWWRERKIVWWGAYATESQALDAAGAGE